MSEEVKYKVGDEVLLKATVKELSGYSCILDFGLLGKAVKYQATIAQMDINKKVKIPQFVADIIVSLKENDMTLYDALNIYSLDDDINEIDDWVQENSDTFARAWLDGYEVEKEKRYKVKFMNLMTSDGKEQLLTHDIPKRKVFASRHRMNLKQTFTRGELVSLGFEGVFDNPMFEVEEVE